MFLLNTDTKKKRYVYRNLERKENIFSDHNTLKLKVMIVLN